MSEDHPRIIRQRIDRLQYYLALLWVARSVKGHIDGDTTQIDEFIKMGRSGLDSLLMKSGQRIEVRHRPKQQRWDAKTGSRPQYLLFMDECGSHPVDKYDPGFPVFCLAGCIMEKSYYEKVAGPKFRDFKAQILGNAERLLHEPDVRWRSRPVYFRGDTSKQKTFDKQLEDLLDGMEYIVIAAAIDKVKYEELYKIGPVDAFLPASHYLICLDFVMERFVHFLFYQGKDAKGHIVAESRGIKEDLEVQAEYLRLQMEGTQYISNDWFRYQLNQTIEFRTKADNISGLQFADFIARPIAEKIVNPARTSVRWQVNLNKFYDGGKNDKSGYGLKVFPNRDMSEFGL